MARRRNFWEDVVSEVRRQKAEIKEYARPHVRGGEYPPFELQLTPKQERQLYMALLTDPNPVEPVTPAAKLAKRAIEYTFEAAERKRKVQRRQEVQRG